VPRVAADVRRLIGFYPVTQRMNKPSYDEPDCIEPLVALESEVGAWRGQLAPIARGKAKVLSASAGICALQSA
jgi:hypothetical protein